MFAYKAHNPYVLTLQAGPKTDELRKKIDTLVSKQQEALELC